MTNKIISLPLLFSLLTAVGCSKYPSTTYLVDYACNVDQLDMAEREFKTCNTTSYSSAYCWATAKKTQCTYVGKHNRGETL